MRIALLFVVYTSLTNEVGITTGSECPNSAYVNLSV